jgi:multidrug resistance efflux pump
MKIRFHQPENSDTSRDRGIQVPYGSAKRNLARWRWYLILAIVSSPLVYFVGHTVYSTIVVEAPGVVNQEQVTARALIQGYVEEVYVKPLQPVKAGDPIARLADPELLLRRQKLQAELAELQKIAGRVTGGGTIQRTIREQIGIAQQQHNDSRQRAQVLEELAAQGAATETEVATARSEYQQSMAQIAALNQSAATQGRDSAGLDIKTRVVSAQAELSDLNRQIEQLVIRAPKEGRVIDVPVVVGDQLPIGGEVAMLIPTGGEMRVNSYISPRHAEYAVRGHPATVLFPDGTHERAEVVDVPEIAQELPASHAGWFGSRELGVLVRLKFVDDHSGARQKPLTDGLPVKVHFDGSWNVRSVSLTRKLVGTWETLRNQLTEWIS